MAVKRRGKRVWFTITEKDDERLNEICERTLRSRSQVISWLIRAEINKVQDDPSYDPPTQEETDSVPAPWG